MPPQSRGYVYYTQCDIAGSELAGLSRSHRPGSADELEFRAGMQIAAFEEAVAQDLDLALEIPGKDKLIRKKSA